VGMSSKATLFQIELLMKSFGAATTARNNA
jgi:hypothetical protein